MRRIIGNRYTGKKEGKVMELENNDEEILWKRYKGEVKIYIHTFTNRKENHGTIKRNIEKVT